MLLSVATIINRKNKALLKSHETKTNPDLVEKVERNDSTVLNAICSVLVRKDEVIAAAAYKLDGATSTFTSNGTGTPDSVPLAVITASFEELTDQDDQDVPSKFVTTANPDHQYKYVRSNANGEVFFVETGRSHWPTVLTDSWVGIMEFNKT
jgi:hypothetical protein